MKWVLLDPALSMDHSDSRTWCKLWELTYLFRAMLVSKAVFLFSNQVTWYVYQSTSIKTYWTFELYTTFGRDFLIKNPFLFWNLTKWFDFEWDFMQRLWSHRYSSPLKKRHILSYICPSLSHSQNNFFRNQTI